jgi:predicted enzyme related to lactoylglutathione lyase
MLASCPINGFVLTTDAGRSRSFYEGVLGLTFVSENDYVTMFRNGTSMIIAQKVAAFEPAHSTVLGWEVPDIRSVVASLTKSGVVFQKYGWMQQDELGIWESPDARVAWFKDPDGNVLSVSCPNV